jgi:molecular chaperone GrpE
MSECPPPGVAAGAAGRGAQALTPDAVAAVLADFQSWLRDLASSPPAAEPAPSPAIDLHTLLGGFVALRHEVNLQTRATRAQQEQNAEALRQLSEALEALRRAPQPAQEEAARPLLKTLVDLYDSLALAEREVRRVREAVLPALEVLLAALVPAEAPRRSLWARWFGAARADEGQERWRQAREAGERVRAMLASLATGYTMSLQRLDRALRQHGLEPMAVVGTPFDPERMEVLEAVADSGRGPGEVLDEVRRGYLWNGRVFRYAQVRVARA